MTYICRFLHSMPGCCARISSNGGMLRRDVIRYRNEHTGVRHSILCVSAVASHPKEWDTEELGFHVFSWSDLHSVLLGQLTDTTAKAADGIAPALLDVFDVGS